MNVHAYIRGQGRDACKQCAVGSAVTAQTQRNICICQETLPARKKIQKRKDFTLT
jgi:hypothetical protein